MQNEKPTTTARPHRCMCCLRPTQLQHGPIPGVHYGDFAYLHKFCLNTVLAAAALNVRLHRLRGVEGYELMKGRN